MTTATATPATGTLSPRLTAATAGRVLRQLRPGHRTVGLLVVVPLVLRTLLRYVFDAQPQAFDRIGGPLLALFPFTSMFLVTSVAMLRERTSGTLERLLSMPIGKADLLLRTGTQDVEEAFLALAARQEVPA